MTQAELEAHPEWKEFGTEAGKHPPMRGWLAAPLVGRDGTNWGLVQLSDKYEGDFTEEDEKYFIKFVELVSATLEALWDARNLRKKVITV
jgi:GAF domain-containing protein